MHDLPVERSQLIAREFERGYGAHGWTVQPWRAGVDYWADLVLDPRADGSIVGVLRSPRHEVQQTGYEGTVDFGSTLQTEVAVLDLLATHGVPVPRVLGWARRSRPDGRSWMLLEHIPHDPDPALTPDLLRQLGALTARIHGIRPAPADLCVGARTEPWDAFIGERLSRRLRAAEAYCDGPLPIEAVLDRCTQVLPERVDEANALLHLDLRASNLCVLDGRIAAVLDVSNAMIGDPLLELARIRSYGLLSTDFVRGYGRDAASDPLLATVLDVYELDTAALLTVVAREEADDPALFETSRARLLALCSRLAE